MNWPWRKLEQSGQPAAAAPAVAAPLPALDVAIAQADAMRDARHWADAADAYDAIVRRAPDRAALWVQLGHARKESGDLPAAEGAYRHALDLAPDVADSHLQLGHVLKLQGRRPAAVTAYAQALRADRSCTPALAELIALGEGWEAEQASGLGQHMLAALLQTADQLRDALGRVERALPDAASLVSIPSAQYSLFQARYRLPPPPDVPRPMGWGVLVLDREGPQAVLGLLRSLAAQDMPPAAVTILAAGPATADELRRFGNGGLACAVVVVTPDQPPVIPSCDWLLVVESGSALVPGARAWLDWAAQEVSAGGFYTDEVGSAARPVLKAAHDPQAEAPTYRHTALALRGDVAQGVTAALGTSDPLQAMADMTATTACVGHLARILVQRGADAPQPTRRVPREGGQALDGRLGVIVPTRDGAAVLRPCLDMLRSTAADPARLDIIVLDNGSTEPATLDLLAELEATGVARVLRDPAPFNWSRLNNAGVAACRSALLLFMNDDVALTANGWDTILRRHLGRPEIGAVGARLDYPDGGIQHGGIVFGPDGRAEHEGVAPLGVLPDIAARWTTRRRVGAVTGAFLACRRDDFTACGGFDAAHFAIWFNDIDFCLRLRRAGLGILYEPAIRAIHHESRTLSAQAQDAARRAIWDDSLAELRRRWGDALHTDPGFNPYFARTGRPFELMTEPSPAAIRAHLLRSARPDPWCLD